MTMKRDQALRMLSQHYPDGIVVPVYQSAFDWMGIRPHPLNYLCTGAMGQGSSHALGLALACPEEPVVVLDGDGSLLMNLGSLVTIADQSPRNLKHFVCQNGIYEVNGEFPIPGKNSIDFAAMAVAAGYEEAYTFAEIDAFSRALPKILATPGPIMIALQVEAGETFPRDYPAIHSAQTRAAFKAALAARCIG
ncbi:MAG TPA: thiamine pyrophosphate-binding protein [Gammaproteobacteria bacterium]|nr:thiamine pyrophosphate-binding protein [Gammaproteobacteria bacterium]|tara:strand:+ start:2046 stop:2624 length:579 start_codon:yes stop_codon:yes gene_type:complete